MNFETLVVRARLCPMFPVCGSSQEQEAFSVKYANVILKVRRIQEEQSKNQPRTKRIDGLVKEFIVKKPVESKCQAVNLNNTPCKFKATCGKFCKKHKVTVEMLEMLE